MITVVGSLNMDLVTYVDKMPKPGQTVMGRSFKQMAGGKGANQADAIAKLGATVKMIGCIGDDDLGRTLISSLKKDGVDISGVSTVGEVSTGIASITVDADGNNCIAVVPGANNMLTVDRINLSMKAIYESDIVVAQLEVPMDTIKYAMKAAKNFGKLTILNPAPAMELDDEILREVDYLIPNDTELEVISGINIENDDDMRRAAGILINRGVSDLIVTLGDKGCMHFNSRGEKKYDAYSVRAVDTTAAGDRFIGALAVSLHQGKKIEDAIQYAMAVGAITVTRIGAQSSLPNACEVDAFIKTGGI